MDYYSLLYGALGGVGWAVLGYARAKQKDSKTEFDGFHFGKTIVVGAIIGGYAAYTGMPIDAVATTSFALTATALVDKIANIIISFFRK